MADARDVQATFDFGGARRSTAVASRFSRSTQVDRLRATEGLSRWLTAEEAAAYLGFPTRKALYAAVERGQVAAHRLGRRLRFSRFELDRAVLAFGSRAPSPER